METQFILVRDIFSPYDHAAIRVDDLIYSLYPYLYPVGGIYSLGEVHIDRINDFKNKYDQNNVYFLTLNININSQEEQKLKHYFINILDKNINSKDKIYYSLFGNQCATTANNALESIGIINYNFDRSYVKSPYTRYNDLINNLKVKQNEPQFPKYYK